MAKRTTPPLRADHDGSLLRPPALLRARDDHAAGRLSVQFHDEPGDTTVEGNALSSGEQVARLRLIVETAEDVWG
jgi:hypothetical protein